MNTRLITGAVAAVLVLTVAVSIGFTEDAPAKPQPLSEMELWPKMMELAQPTAMHKDVLSKFVGDWTTAGKIFTGMGEMPINGTSKNTSVMDGRFIHINYGGTFMGRPFGGQGHIGYDNLTKKFQQTWIMNMSSAIDFSTGTWDAKTKVLTWKSKTEMPGRGGNVTYHNRTTITFNDDGTIKSEAFSGLLGAKPKKEMEIVYTPVKKKAEAPAK